MSKLIDGRAEVFDFYRKKCKKLLDQLEELQLKDPDLEDKVERVRKRIGVVVRPAHFNNHRLGFEDACRAIGRQTNAVLVHGIDRDEFVIVYADDAAAAKKRILKLAKELRRLAEIK